KQGQVVRMHRGRISARRCAHHYPLTRREPQMRRDIVRMHLGGTDAKSNVTTWLRLGHGCVRSNEMPLSRREKMKNNPSPRFAVGSSGVLSSRLVRSGHIGNSLVQGHR